MKNTQKGFVKAVVLIIIIILLVGGYYLYRKGGVNYDNYSIEPTTNPNQNTASQNSGSINSKCGFSVTSPKTNAEVAFPLTVTGTVDNSNAQSLGCRWTMFEGQAGSAQLYYKSDGTWHLLGTGSPIPILVADERASKTTFSTSLNFNNGGIGLPNGTPIKIVFTEENVSGIGAADVVEVEVVLKN